MLFGLESKLSDARAQESVWGLIGQLKTSPKLYLSLLKNENLAERLGKPAEVPTFKLLYNLQILHSFLSSYGRKRAGSVTLYFEPERRPHGSQAASGGGGWQSAGSGGGKDDSQDIGKRQQHYDEHFPKMEESKENGDWKGSRSRHQGQGDGAPQLDTVPEDDQENGRNIAGDHWNAPVDSEAPQTSNPN